MKNATEYGKKVKRMLPSLKKRYSAAPLPDDMLPLEIFVVGVLREGVRLPAALKAMKLIDEEFIDFNEIRVAPPKDIVELLTNDMPDLRTKAEQITMGLNRIYDHENRLDFEHTADMGKRELRAHLREALGLSPFVEAYLLLYLFGHRAVPVDSRLVQRLKADKLVHPGATDDDVRILLERVIRPKDQASQFELLALYADEPIKAPAKKKAKPVKKAAKKATKKTVKKTVKKATKAKTKTAKKAAKKTKTKRK